MNKKKVLIVCVILLTGITISVNKPSSVVLAQNDIDIIVENRIEKLKSEGYGGFELSDWEYSGNSDMTILAKYRGDKTKVAIPGKFAGSNARILLNGPRVSLGDKRNEITHVKAVAIDGMRPEQSGTLRSGFRLMDKLEYVDLSEFNMSPVWGDDIDMAFLGCTNLKEVNVLGLNLEKMVSAKSVFQGCEKLTTIIGLNTWKNVSGIESFENMFDDCYALENVDISSWNISGLTNTGFMFNGCRSLMNVNLPDFKNAEAFVSSMYMFRGCKSLTSIDLSRFIAPHLVNVQGMFENSAVEEVDLSPLNSSDDLRVMTGIFRECSSLTKVIMPKKDTITHASRMFYDCISLDFIDLRNFDTTKIAYSNFSKNFYISPDKNNDRRPFLVLSTDEKVIDYEFSKDNRIGSGPIINANGGSFSNGADVSKVDNIYVLPNLEEASFDEAIENAMVDYRPKFPNHKFLGWKKTENDLVKMMEANGQAALDRLNRVEYVARWSIAASVLNRVPTINATDKVLLVGDSYHPLTGVTAQDKEDGYLTLTEANVIANNVNVNSAGTYSVTYKITDSEGASVEKTILVIVKEKVDKPVKPDDVDKPVIPDAGKPNGTDKPVKSEVTKSNDTMNSNYLNGQSSTPQTGDLTNAALLTSMFAGSLGFLIVKYRKKEK